MKKSPIVTLKEWKNAAIDRYKNQQYNFLEFSHTQAAEYLYNKLDFCSGFILNPTEVVDEKLIETRTKQAFDIDEVVEYFLTFEKHFVFYDVLFIPSLPQFKKINPETYDLEDLDEMTMSKACWKIRYAILPEPESFYFGN